MIPLSKPDITQEDINAVVDVLRSGRLARGPKAQEFADAVAKRAGRRFGVPVSSGTAALHLIVKACGIGPGDEVITTPFSFVASTNCILYEGATPVFVDIDPNTLCIDPARVRSAVTPKTKAILAVDIFGNVCDYRRLTDIACEYGISIIEDACEAIGAPGAGSHGDAAAFAFYPNKQIVAGEGGVIVTDDPDLAEYTYRMMNQGRDGLGDFACLGYNYRMDEMSGALGLSQMGRLDDILGRRRAVARRYTAALADCGLPIRGNPQHESWFVYVVFIPRGIDRGGTIRRMHDAGVEARAYFNPIHKEPYMAAQNWRAHGSLAIAEDKGSRCLALPFYHTLTDAEMRHVCRALADSLRAQGVPSVRRPRCEWAMGIILDDAG